MSPCVGAQHIAMSILACRSDKGAWHPRAYSASCAREDARKGDGGGVEGGAQPFHPGRDSPEQFCRPIVGVMRAPSCDTGPSSRPKAGLAPGWQSDLITDERFAGFDANCFGHIGKRSAGAHKHATVATLLQMKYDRASAN